MGRRWSRACSLVKREANPEWRPEALAAIERPQSGIRLSYSVNEATFFIQAKFQFRQANRIVVKAEMPMYKLQRREALRIFRQTFAITYALEIIGVVVAVAGLGFTLMSLLLERRAELTTLRALGFTHREIAATTVWESGAWRMVGTTFTPRVAEAMVIPVGLVMSTS